MSRRLAIFDIDGTLVDSQNHIVAAMSHAFDATGLDCPPREVMLSVVGLSLETLFDVLAGSAPVEVRKRLARLYRAAFTDPQVQALAGTQGHAPLYEGAREMLDRLSGPGGPLMGIATGKARRGVERMYAAHGLAGVFATAQTADEHPSKPDPSMILRAVAECDVAPSHAVMIGDTEFDLAMGRAAGVRTIAVTWGYHPLARLKAQRPDLIVNDFGALEAAISEVLAA